MTVALYMDVHIPRAITTQLRLRGVDVLTAQEDGYARSSDSRLLDRATALGRVLVSQDQDLLIEADRRLHSSASFAGLIFSRPLDISIGRSVADLHLIAQATESSDWLNRVEYLPL
jgi:hypothetical protein